VWSTLVRGDEAQDTLEYVIAIGIVVVVMMGLLLGIPGFAAPGFGMPGIIRLGVEAMCSTIDPVGFATPTPTPPCIVP
jgi:hypothetical protein